MSTIEKSRTVAWQPRCTSGTRRACASGSKPPAIRGRLHVGGSSRRWVKPWQPEGRVIRRALRLPMSVGVARRAGGCGSTFPANGGAVPPCAEAPRLAGAWQVAAVGVNSGADGPIHPGSTASGWVLGGEALSIGHVRNLRFRRPPRRDAPQPGSRRGSAGAPVDAGGAGTDGRGVPGMADDLGRQRIGVSG
jgi:hypothetical protein